MTLSRLLLAQMLEDTEAGTLMAGSMVDEDGTARIELLERREAGWWNLTLTLATTSIDMSQKFDDVVVTSLPSRMTAQERAQRLMASTALTLALAIDDSLPVDAVDESWVEFRAARYAWHVERKRSERLAAESNDSQPHAFGDLQELGYPPSNDLRHWVGDAPTSLHGNGADSFEFTTRDTAAVTCPLCLSLLARESNDSGTGISDAPVMGDVKGT